MRKQSLLTEPGTFQERIRQDAPFVRAILHGNMWIRVLAPTTLTTLSVSAENSHIRAEDAHISRRQEPARPFRDDTLQSFKKHATRPRYLFHADMFELAAAT
jgi:hypothetical protein